MYEVDFAKAEIEQKEPVDLGFFILQYAKLRMLELSDNSFDKFCNIDKFEELEMDTETLCLAHVEKERTDSIGPEMKAEWERLGSKDCDDSFAADASGDFFSRTCCAKHKRFDKRAGSFQIRIQLFGNAVSL